MSVGVGDMGGGAVKGIFKHWNPGFFSVVCYCFIGIFINLKYESFASWDKGQDSPFSVYVERQIAGQFTSLAMSLCLTFLEAPGYGITKLLLQE